MSLTKFIIHYDETKNLYFQKLVVPKTTTTKEYNMKKRWGFFLRCWETCTVVLVMSENENKKYN
jgi:hypothetical protein